MANGAFPFLPALLLVSYLRLTLDSLRDLQLVQSLIMESVSVSTVLMTMKSAAMRTLNVTMVHGTVFPNVFLLGKCIGIRGNPNFNFCRCKQIPAPPSNGMIVVADTSHGSSALFQCRGDTLISYMSFSDI